MNEVNVSQLEELRGGLIQGTLQIFDLKQLADWEEHYRQRCRQSIRRYRNWKKQYAAQTDMIELLYGSIEGTLLRREAEDAVRLYGMIRRDSKAAWNNYIARLNVCAYPGCRQAA